MKNTGHFAGSVLTIFALASLIHAHCQIPCGIYDDQMRFSMLREHITTIEKSMNQIMELSTDPGKNINQLVRWVNNKDQHANEFSEIISYYFLAQRIKIADPADTQNFADYQKKLVTLHQLVFYAMKAKQTTELGYIKKLTELVDTFEKMYFSPEDLEHLKEHKN